MAETGIATLKFKTWKSSGANIMLYCMRASSAADEEIFNVMPDDWSSMHQETIELQFEPGERIVSAKVCSSENKLFVGSIEFLVFAE